MRRGNRCLTGFSFVMILGLLTSSCASSGGASTSARGDIVSADARESGQISTVPLNYVPFAITLERDQSGRCSTGYFQLALRKMPGDGELALASVRLFKNEEVIGQFTVTATSGFSGNVVVHLTAVADDTAPTRMTFEEVVVEISLQSGFSRREVRPLAVVEQ